MPRFQGVPVEQEKRPRFAGQPADASNGQQPNATPPLLARRPPKRQLTAAQLTGISDAQMDPSRSAPTTRAGRLRQAAQNLPLGNPVRFIADITDPATIAGIGKSFADTGRGLRQAANQAGQVQVGLVGEALKRTGILDQGQWRDFINRYGIPLYERQLQMQAEEGQRRQTDAPLMANPRGLAGNVIGTGAQFLGPGVALRGSAAGAALLPRTVAGNAALGTTLGILQPNTSQGDQMFNAGLGGTFGAVGGMVPGAFSMLRRAFSPGLSGAEARAGRSILEAAQGPVTYAPSTIPGVQRTLGEGAQLPGLLAQEDAIRTARPELFRQLDEKNNLARVAALEQIAGTDSELMAAQAARDAASAPFYEAARQAPTPADPQLEAVLARVPARIRAKARALAQIEGQSIGDQIDGTMMHYVKMALDNEISKAGTSGIGAAEKRVLTGLKSDLLSEYGRLVPDYQTGMTNFAQASGPINRMQFGRELLGSGSAGVRDVAGKPRILPGTFAKAEDLNAIAQRATGFKGARAQDFLTPDDLSVIAGIQDDMRRQFARQSSPAGNSATAQRMSMLGRMTERAGMAQWPKIGGYLQMLQQGRSAATMDKLAYLYANPQEAERVLAALGPNERKALEQALMVFGGNVGAMTPALTQ